MAVRALTPVSIAHGTPVMRLSVPAQQASGQTPPRVISAVLKGPEVKSDTAASKQECEVKTLQLVKEEKPADGSKTARHPEESPKLQKASQGTLEKQPSWAM